MHEVAVLTADFHSLQGAACCEPGVNSLRAPAVLAIPAHFLAARWNSPPPRVSFAAIGCLQRMRRRRVRRWIGFSKSARRCCCLLAAPFFVGPAWPRQARPWQARSGPLSRRPPALRNWLGRTPLKIANSRGRAGRAVSLLRAGAARNFRAGAARIDMVAAAPTAEGLLVHKTAATASSNPTTKSKKSNARRAKCVGLVGVRKKRRSKAATDLRPHRISRRLSPVRRLL